MKDILIPYDFSEVAENALNYVQKFFEDVPVNIFLLSVYVSTPSKMIGERYNEEWFNKIDDSIEEELKKLVTSLNEQDKKHKYHAVIKSDSINNAIKQVVNDKKIDLIVTGTKGVHGLSEIFIGSNTMRMINAIHNCAIMVVPTGYKYKPFQQIVFSTNYKRAFTVEELHVLLGITQLKQSLIEVVNLAGEEFLTEQQLKNKAKLKELLEGFEATYKKLDWQDSETSTIEKYMETSMRELLVLINHKNNFFNRLTEENVIKKSTFHTKTPLLILPEV
ncbi:universal stress protein [Tenacibaculum sp. TC6]|uniref:universal stress protein n=1 Tax=Tenacibaculum sp. TC6 TaxID=3423223 RepID=UPI003D35B7F7